MCTIISSILNTFLTYQEINVIFPNKDCIWTCSVDSNSKKDIWFALGPHGPYYIEPILKMWRSILFKNEDILSIYLDLSNSNFKKILNYARLILKNLFWHQKKLPFYLFEKKPHTPCRSVHLNSLYKEIFKCIVIYISFYKVLNISHGMLE